MKTYNLMKTAMALALASSLAISLQSCDDDDNYYYPYYALPNALVTVKTEAATQTPYLQLDDSTTLLPVNMSTSPFGKKEVRALVNYSPVESNSSIYDQAVYINWIDSILTKPIVPNLGTQNDQVYGSDPVEMVDDWVTIAEDGYLTLRFRTYWGGQQTHFVNLLYGVNAEDPYEVEFRHNAYGDLHGQAGDGLVAFRLDALPDTQGKTVKLTLKWESFSGEKTAQFDYCTRRSTPTQGTGTAGVRSTLRLQ